MVYLCGHSILGSHRQITAQFAVLNKHMISRVQMVITFAMGNPCIPCSLVEKQSVEDTFWHQRDHAATKSHAACLAAMSAANRKFEVISSFSCFIRLNESSI